jgi:hypothetical protein
MNVSGGMDAWNSSGFPLAQEETGAEASGAR